MPGVKLSGAAAVGGVTGYLKKGSITSLTASSIFGVVYVGAAYLMRTPASAVPGLRIALGDILC